MSKHPVDTDELFGLLIEFADAVKAACPKPAAAAPPPPAPSKSAVLHPTTIAPVTPSTQAEPMLSKMQSGSTEASVGADLSTGQTSRRVTTDRSDAVDKRMQERLAKRFERAQARASHR